MGTEGSVADILAFKIDRTCWSPKQPELQRQIDEAIRSNAAGHAQRIGADLLARWALEIHKVKVSSTTMRAYMKRRAKEIGV